MSDITVIAFYPGGGGNRYMQKLLNNEFSTPHIAYDYKFKELVHSHRYLLDDIPEPPRSEYVLTHCMNYSRIRSVFGDVDIRMIVTDFKKSLQREWMLNGNMLYKQTYAENQEDTIVSAYNGISASNWPVCTNYADFLKLPLEYQTEVLSKLTIVPFELMSAWATITWHNKYYARYPVSTGSATVVSDLDFITVIDDELARFSNDIFDFCWDHSDPTLPIVDLYNQHIVGQG